MTARLPRLLVLTDRTQCERPLVDVVAAAVEGGARAVVLREKDLPAAERRSLAEAVAALLAPVGGVLVVAAGGDGSAPEARAAGVHLPAGAPLPPAPRRATLLVGRSCHDVAAVAAAGREGCDYATLSPIFASASKPGYGPALGLGALGDTPLPVYALGGVDTGNARLCVDAGAAGVAVMGAVMRAPDPAAATAALVAAVGRG